MAVLFVLLLIAGGIGLCIFAGHSLAALMFKEGPGRVAAAVLFSLLAMVALVAVVIAGCSLVLNNINR